MENGNRLLSGCRFDSGSESTGALAAFDGDAPVMDVLAEAMVVVVEDVVALVVDVDREVVVATVADDVEVALDVFEGEVAPTASAAHVIKSAAANTGWPLTRSDDDRHTTGERGNVASGCQ